MLPVVPLVVGVSSLGKRHGVAWHGMICGVERENGRWGAVQFPPSRSLLFTILYCVACVANISRG